MQAGTITLWKSVSFVLRILDIVLPEDSAILLLGIYPEDATTFNKDTCSIMFIASILIITKSWKQLRCPSSKNAYRKCGMLTKWTTAQLLKSMTS